MKLLILLVATFSSSFGVPASQLDGRIVGGNDIPIEQVPYQISLQRDGVHNCGGSILTPNYVVTAAHCTDYAESRLSVRAGSTIRETGGQVVAVKKIHNHPSYDGFVDYDVSILELANNLIYGEGVKPIALPKRSQTWPAGTKALASGWGLTNEEVPQFATNLQGVTLDLQDRNTCESAYRGFFTDRMICAGGEAGKGICSSDSGGPLQIDGILAGIVSFGTGCGRAGYPGGFASVSSVLLDFIEEITNL